MTRSLDEGIPLEKRIKKLNKKSNPDLLISIHANSSVSDKACGIETFCLKSSLFKVAGEMKNARCHYILNKFRKKQYKKSERFANLIQKTTFASAKKINPFVVNRGIKHAVARMLLGIDFPGALVEVGFLTNKKELKLLRTNAYQSIIAHSLCRSIISYFKQS